VFDLFNVGFGGGGGRYSNGVIAAAHSGVTSQTIRRPGISEYAKKAKAFIRQIDVASLDYWEFADEIWNLTNDAQKVHVFRLIDALIARALDAHDRGMAFTLVEQAIGDRANTIRETVYENGV
jgi:hypothetical protein